MDLLKWCPHCKRDTLRGDYGACPCEERRRMFFAGYKAALERYGVWNNGERLIGVRRQPLGDVLAGLDADPDVLVDLSIALREKEPTDD